MQCKLFRQNSQPLSNIIILSVRKVVFCTTKITSIDVSGNSVIHKIASANFVISLNILCTSPESLFCANDNSPVISL